MHNDEIFEMLDRESVYIWENEWFQTKYVDIIAHFTYSLYKPSYLIFFKNWQISPKLIKLIS